MGSEYTPDPKMLEATSGFEPLIEVLQTSALPLGHVAEQRSNTRTPPQLDPYLGDRWTPLERKTRFELATLSLARRCSTTEPLPHEQVPRIRIELMTPRFSVACSTN